jgi:SNF2 family DNA or RNA helicase
MPIAELTGTGRIALWETAFQDNNLVKMVPGHRFAGPLVGDSKIWHYPQSWATCLALRGVFGSRLQIGPQLNAWAFHERTNRINPAMELRSAMDADGDTDLYPFQRAGVKFLTAAKQAILGDEMGTGKTVQTIRALRKLQDEKGDAFPVCIVCPNSMKTTWEREWMRWDNRAHVIILTGGIAKIRKQVERAQELIESGRDVALVINWESTWRVSRVAPYGSVHMTEDQKKPKVLNNIAFRSVVCDEAHRMKSPKAVQTRATWTLQHQDSVNYRFSLTGTPIANHPAELWSLLHGIAPEDYPTKTAFVDRYCLQSWNPFGGLDIVGVRPDTRDEFYAILDPRFRRMSKDLVLQQLPRKSRITRYVEMGPKQKKAYSEMESQMATKLDDGTVLLATNDLAVNTRLLQFASSYATVDETGQVQLQEPSPKLDTMEEIIEELEGASVVIAAESRKLIELAAKRLDKSGVTYRMIVGGLSGEIRQAAIDDFQAGRAQVMLMTLKAGGVGLTLTRAGVIVFLQRSWSMVDNKQGEDRVHRIGSEVHDKILVIDIVTEGTIEETQIPRLHAKLNRLQEIVRDIEVARTNNDLNAIARLEGELGFIEASPLWTPETAPAVTEAIYEESMA